MTSFYIGIDIQVRRDCCYAVLDENSNLFDSGWFFSSGAEALKMVHKFCAITPHVSVGVDAPRMPLHSKRQWYWDRRKRRWDRRDNQKGYGRHCEVVISAHGIANPQWTPLGGQAPEWMNLGFKIFSILEGVAKVHEVFPTASYALLKGIKNVQIKVDFSACSPGPKDMLDAWVAAATVREFVEGRGTEVGGGDGLGTIVLPRQLPEPIIEEVCTWPK